MADTSTAPIGLGVKLPFASQAEFAARYRDNVTRGGIFLRAKKVLPPGTAVNLDLKLSSGERLLHGSAVVEFVTGQSGANGTSGMGLRFIKLDPESQGFLEQTLQGHKGAFIEKPPLPPGVGPVQYADKPVDKPPEDTAVTRVMNSLPNNWENLGKGPEVAGGGVPLPAPGGSPPPAQASDPFSVPLPAPGGALPPVTPAIPSVAAPHVAPAVPMLAPVAPPARTVTPVPYQIPPQPPAVSPLPFEDVVPGTTTPGVPLPSFEDVITSSAVTPARGVPVLSFDKGVATPATTPARGEPAAAPQIDPALWSWLEGDSSDPRAFLKLPANAAAAQARDAASRFRNELRLDAAGADPLTARARAAVGRRLDAAVHALEHPAAESLDTIAAKALLDGNPANAYDVLAAREDVSGQVLAAFAASAAASQTRDRDWLEKAHSAAERVAGPTPFGSPWAMVAQAASELGDAVVAQAAVAQLQMAQPNLPLGAASAGRRGMGTPLIAVLAIVAAAAGFAAGGFTGPSLGIFGRGKAPAVVKTVPDDAKMLADAKAAQDAKAAADAKSAEDAKAAADAKAATDAKAAADAKKPEDEGTALAALTTPKKAPEDPEKARQRKAAEAAENELLSKAEAAIKANGDCNQFVIPLGDMVATGASKATRGKAIIMRARCFDVQSKSTMAKAEYQKYLKAYPHGPFADEAHDSN